MANIASRHRYITNLSNHNKSTSNDGKEPTSGLSYGTETIPIGVYTTSIDGPSFAVVSGHGFVAAGAVGKAACGRLFTWTACVAV